MTIHTQISNFAAEAGPHISLKAEPIFDIGSQTITNAMAYGVVVAISIAALVIFAASKVERKPNGGIGQFLEMALEFVISLTTQALGSRAKAVKYAPIFAVFFIFIVLNNLSGLLPLVGEGITVNETPAFRPFTADLNGTIALSVFAVLLVQYLSVKENGLKGHLKHYFTDKPFNPINFFIGVLEVFGEFTRVASLALRLFVNTAVGEILIAVFNFIGGYGSSFTLIPIVSFEILVALIQAYVFTVLSATYLGLATSHGHHEDDEHDPEEVHQNVAQLSPSGEI